MKKLLTCKIVCGLIALASGMATFQFGGCADTGLYGDNFGYYPMDTGYGPIDWDVFESANDAWDDYIRS